MTEHPSTACFCDACILRRRIEALQERRAAGQSIASMAAELHYSVEEVQRLLALGEQSGVRPQQKECPQ